MEPGVEFVTPPTPKRGGRARDDERDEALTAALRGQAGSYAVYGRYEDGGVAEAARRRINRGKGSWRGGRDVWSVLIRKVDGEWLVYVAYRETRATAAAS
jgi:hypothetical protein